MADAYRWYLDESEEMICGPDGLDMDEDETILIEIPGGWFRTGLLWVTMAIVATATFMGAAVLISLIIR